MQHNDLEKRHSGLQALRAALLTDASREFVHWAATIAGADGVLERGQFNPEDLAPWLGRLAILEWDASANDFRYRLFGSELPALRGRDLSGLTMAAAWPENVAQVKRRRLVLVIARQVPVVAQTMSSYFGKDGQVVRGHTVVEQVMWPLRYGTGNPDAILDFTIAAPVDQSLALTESEAAERHIRRCFAGDGTQLD